MAASALRSGGLHAVVFDEFFGGMVWTQQVALKGFRLMAPADEREDAVGYFRALPEYRPRRARLSPADTAADTIWRVMTFLVWYVVPPLGWMMVGALRRGRKGRLTEIAMGGAMSLIAFLLISVVTLFLTGSLAAVWTPAADGCSPNPCLLD